MLKSIKQYFEDNSQPRSEIGRAYGSVGVSAGKKLLDADRVFYKLIDNDTSGVRRLIRTNLSRGVFDDDEQLKSAAEELYKKLSTGSFQRATEKASDILSGSKDQMAKPMDDENNEENSGI